MSSRVSETGVQVCITSLTRTHHGNYEVSIASQQHPHVPSIYLVLKHRTPHIIIKRRSVT